MNQNDDKLRALLKNWKSIEPRDSFEADVRRRIRLTATEHPVPVGGILIWLVAKVSLAARWATAPYRSNGRAGWPSPPRTWLQELLWKPALGIAVAVVAGVVIGAAAGIFSVTHPNQPGRAELQFMSGGTLSGGYVKLASGGRR